MSSSEIVRPTIAKIDLGNLAYNYHSSRSFIGDDIRYMAVVKADAYGHGAVECSRQLQAEGVDWLGVALMEEGVELRNAGITLPILCLGSFWPGQQKTILDREITTVLYQLDHAKLLNEAARHRNVIANVHIKIDTGMGRIGVRFENVTEFSSEMKKLKNLRVDGLMTHFAAAEDVARTAFTESQIDHFYDAVDVFRRDGFDPIYIDLANSPGAVVHPRSRGNMVRLGGILYGLAGDILPNGFPKPDLRPVLSLRSKIEHLKCVPEGEGVGYGHTFITARESLIATVPIGYRDGYRRGLSNRADVIINGFFAPVIGRISMDWTLIDVTDVPNVKHGDDVILIGEQNGLTIKAEDLASIIDTISYEITCGISDRVERQYVSLQRRAK